MTFWFILYSSASYIRKRLIIEKIGKPVTVGREFLLELPQIQLASGEQFAHENITPWATTPWVTPLSYSLTTLSSYPSGLHPKLPSGLIHRSTAKLNPGLSPGLNTGLNTGLNLGLNIGLKPGLNPGLTLG